MRGQVGGVVQIGLRLLAGAVVLLRLLTLSATRGCRLPLPGGQLRATVVCGRPAGPCCSEAPT